jgi:hypothetical protein
VAQLRDTGFSGIEERTIMPSEYFAGMLAQIEHFPLRPQARPDRGSADVPTLALFLCTKGDCFLALRVSIRYYKDVCVPANHVSQTRQIQ